MAAAGRSSAQLMLLGEGSLVGLAAGGDVRAFGELARRHGPAALDLLRRLGASPSLAEDLVQDALVAAFRGLHTFRGEATFSTWLRKIAARLYFRRRRGDVRAHIATDPLDPETPTDGPGTASDARLDLDQALARLGELERTCVSLCHGAGFTHAEIAELVGAPLGTVKSHVLRGMAKLRRLLGAPEADKGAA